MEKAVARKQLLFCWWCFIYSSYILLASFLCYSSIIQENNPLDMFGL